jgi:hypothetical protein
VIDELRARVRRGESLGAQTYSKALTCAASRYFGGWRQVLVCAGIVPQEN